MTVCIAAACDRATKAVVATDRVLSYAGIVSDVLPGKMIWLDDWLVLYAGSPANTAMIVAAIREVIKGKLKSNNVRKALYTAYRRRKGLLSSFPSLSPYDMTLEAFKKEGLRKFGEPEFRRLSQEIAQTDLGFNEQLLAVGWGKTPHAVMLYEVSPDGDRDHHFSGIAAIGSGSEVALSTIMLLGQSRDSSLAETLYRVAAAKFASEKSTEGDVGRKTSIYISWKRNHTDAAHRPPGKFLEEEHVNRLYSLWDLYGRPRISNHVFPPVRQILHSLGVTSQQSAAELNAFFRLASEQSKTGQHPSENKQAGQADSAESKE